MGNCLSPQTNESPRIRNGRVNPEIIEKETTMIELTCPICKADYGMEEFCKPLFTICGGHICKFCYLGKKFLPNTRNVFKRKICIFCRKMHPLIYIYDSMKFPLLFQRQYLRAGNLVCDDCKTSDHPLCIAVCKICRAGSRSYRLACFACMANNHGQHLMEPCSAELAELMELSLDNFGLLHFHEECKKLFDPIKEMCDEFQWHDQIEQYESHVDLVLNRAQFVIKYGKSLPEEEYTLTFYNFMCDLQKKMIREMDGFYRTYKEKIRKMATDDERLDDNEFDRLMAVHEQ